MALTCGEQPDHSTIAGFVSSMREEILPLFRDVLLVCEEEGLLGGTFFALDGCKLASNASKEWSGTLKDLRWKKEKIEKKVRQLVEEQVKLDREDDEGGPGRRTSGEQRGKGRSRDFSKKLNAWGDGCRRTVPRWGGRAERLRVM